MKFKLSLKLFSALFFVFTFQLFCQSGSYESRIDSLLSIMTLDEKVGQLVQIVGPEKVSEDLIREGKIGSYLVWIQGAGNANRLQRIAVEETRLGIPLIFANDVIHGYHTIFPIPLAESCSWNPELITRACRIAAIESASEGTHWTFAPMVDISRDPRWGRIMEGSGEDAYLGSVLAEASVRGFQGADLKDKDAIAACAKHFVGYGAVEGGRDYNTVDMSERVLREIYLPPFKAAVDAGVETIMSAFNEIGGVPSTANYFTLTQVLRNEWGFKGFVISDYNSIAELVPHGIAADKKEAAFKGFNAGIDMDMLGDTLLGNIYMPNLGELVKDGKVLEKKLDDAVRRILGLKFRLGLFEDPYVDTVYFNKHLPSVEERNNIARELARESVVLLKNDGNILPLSKNVGSIALIGPLADSKADMMGGWSGDGDPEKSVTLLEALRNNYTGKINYARGCDVEGWMNDEFESALKAAQQSDIIIMALGESREMSGEAASRTNLDLPGRQTDLIKLIKSTGKPVIVILFNGRPLTINWMNENIPGIIEAWFPGHQAGNALTDLLFGDYAPSGKLSVTFPRSVGQIPIYYNHKNTGRPPLDIDKFTSKYIDEKVTPLYPFGYGLSYTNFGYSDLELSNKNINPEDTLYVSIKIENYGNFDGSEVVQMYIQDEVGSVTRPVKELKGFKKIFLKKGEEKTVEFKITSDMLAFYNVNNKNTAEPGWFKVMVGGNSDEVISDRFLLK